ncbi:DUF2493 domain-containing protein [Pseudomonas aeruginosa]|uniref:DUF2493 domain-containing protein n=1 Tax=Pseudomonas aeruginosa TaxID=287 RepID=UPI0021F0F673|nr:DUF2493 domain-containing protein [Pseudomonas aeruginosa]UYM64329.1 DUF2493 domain-containing protein [Pseudomonas aeruginosa]
MTRQPHYVVVTGGRYFTNKEVIYGALNAVLSEFRKSNKAGARRFVLVHGAAPGADTLSARWARDCGLAALAVPAEWMTFGRSAGPRRNAEMLEWVPAKLLVAFPRRPRDRPHGRTGSPQGPTCPPGAHTVER